MNLGRVFDLGSNLDAGREALSLLRTRGSLLLAMTWRDLTDRYAGQVLGTTWAVLSPLLMMATYLMAFGLIFRGRLGVTDDGTGYLAFMLAGLVPWMAMQDCLSRAPTAITGQASLVKQIVFPSEILPLRVALSSLPVLAIGLAVTIPIVIFSGSWHLFGLTVLLPIAIICYILFTAGVTLWLAAIGVFARDIKDLVTFLLGIGLFLHPVLYPTASVPVWLNPWFVISPFSHVIW